MTEKHNSRFGNVVLQASVLAMQSTVENVGNSGFQYISYKIFSFPS